MNKCCRNCSYYNHGHCDNNIFVIDEDDDIDSVVDYVISDGILSEALNEPLEEKVKPLYKGNDYEDFRLEFIEDIEQIVRAKIYNDGDRKPILNVDTSTFYCKNWR